MTLWVKEMAAWRRLSFRFIIHLPTSLPPPQPSSSQVILTLLPLESHRSNLLLLFFLIQKKVQDVRAKIDRWQVPSIVPKSSQRLFDLSLSLCLCFCLCLCFVQVIIFMPFSAPCLNLLSSIGILWSLHFDYFLSLSLSLSLSLYLYLYLSSFLSILLNFGLYLWLTGIPPSSPIFFNCMAESPLL